MKAKIRELDMSEVEAVSGGHENQSQLAAEWEQRLENAFPGVDWHCVQTGAESVSCTVADGHTHEAQSLGGSLA